MSFFTIQNVLIFTEDGYQTVDVRIGQDDNPHKIGAIAPQLDPIGTVVDGRNKLLLPGFVNAHTHSPEMWHRGQIPPLPLELWLAELYDFATLTPEQIYLSAVGTAVETLLSGGTTVVDHLVLIPGQEIEAIAAAVRGYQEVGIRAFVGPLIQDQPLPYSIPGLDAVETTEESVLSASANLDLMREAIQRFHQPENGIHIMLAPTGLQLCSDALMTGCVELSDRHQLCRHTHLLETKAQRRLALENYGCTAVQKLAQLEFLGDRTSLAHCVWVDDPDIDVLVQTGSTVVHNPLSNLRLGSGIAPILKYRQAGVNVSLGCDGSASNDGQNLLEVMKIGAMLHNTTDFDYRHWITPSQIVEMAALGGAKGLQLDASLGQLAVGKTADLVLYDLTKLSLMPRTDPMGLLVLGHPVQAVDSVWINGQQRVAQGQVTTLDIEQIRQQFFEQSDWTTQWRSPTRQILEERYRRVMHLEP